MAPPKRDLVLFGAVAFYFFCDDGSANGAEIGDFGGAHAAVEAGAIHGLELVASAFVKSYGILCCKRIGCWRGGVWREHGVPFFIELNEVGDVGFPRFYGLAEIGSGVGGIVVGVFIG